MTLRYPWDWDFPFFSVWPQNKQALLPGVAMLSLFLNWWCYWSWPTVSNPIPFSRPCGQRSAVIWSDPEVCSEPWMDLCVVLVGFGPLHHQLGFKATPFPCPTPSVWAAFDKTLLWYCQNSCFFNSLNRHGPFEAGSQTTDWNTEHIGTCSTHTEPFIPYSLYMILAAVQTKRDLAILCWVEIWHTCTCGLCVLCQHDLSC